MALALRRGEVRTADLRRPDISHAIFDFDGTLSWLRHGWPQIMSATFLAHAPDEWSRNEARRSQLLSDILALNGKPSIHQVRKFCERALDAGHRVPAPEALLDEYQHRLRAAIQDRVASIQNGTRAPDDFLICGARQVMKKLRESGVTLIILSGTCERDVQAETGLLGLTEFVGRHIYGSHPGKDFSKETILERLMREERIQGHQLLAFGDGPVEIRVTQAVGGLAIGVASDEEHNGGHHIDAAKREQLIGAGASVIIPDYAEADLLLAAILSP